MKIEFDLPDSLIIEIDKIVSDTGLSRNEVLSWIITDMHLCIDPAVRAKYKPEQSIRLKKIGIIGCNALSRGIAKLMAIKGVFIVLLGESEQQLAECRQMMQYNLDWMVSKWELTETEKKLIFQQIIPANQLSDLKDVDVVFDTLRCSSEKRIQLYRELEEIIGHDTIIAIDDETCHISLIAENMSYPDRIIGFHLAYPASRRKIVEIMKSQRTSDKTISGMMSIAKFLNKEMVFLHETPGAISSRVLMAMINEALKIWSEGIAPASDIDHLLKMVMNVPMGPFEYADTLGLDIVLDTMEALWNHYGLNHFRPDPRLQQLVLLGHLGKKTGRGILRYESKNRGEVP